MKQTPNRNPTASSRRSFLIRAGSFAVGFAAVPFSGCESLAVEPVTEGTDFPFLTPTESFFAQFGADGAIADWPGVQQIPRGSWRLTIDGLVANPASLTFSDIDADPGDFKTIVSTLRCILDNNAVPGLVGTATWSGVPLSKFLDRAGIDEKAAKRIRIYGADGFTNNLRLDKIYNVDSDLVEPLLVTSMNGSPLRPEHGAPVRLLVPGLYGYKSIKWVERIEVTERDETFGTYQERLGYDDDGEIDISCKTTTLLRGARISAGRTRIAGFALSGAAGIERILVSINALPPREARIVTLNELVTSEPELEKVSQLSEDLYTYPYRGVWTLWSLDWMAEPGDHTITVKAIDAAGHRQPDLDTDPRDGQNSAITINVFVD